MIAREGFALVLSLLLILSLSVLTAGMLLLGTREAVLVSTAGRWAQVRRSAEADVRAAFEAWSTARHAHLRPGQEGEPVEPGPGRTLRVLRLDRELFLIRGDAALPAAGGTAIRGHAALLARTVDRLPLLEVARFAALAADAVVTATAGTVDGNDGCGGVPVPGIAAPVIASTVVGITGEPPLLTGAVPPPLPPLLVGPGIEALAQVTTAPRARPGPRVDGEACSPGPTNWGSVDPWHPCYDLRPLILAAGDLELSGGEMRGVLVVQGDLTIRAGTALEGYILVSGTVRLEPGSTLSGALRAGSIVLDGGVVSYASCALDAVFGAAAFDRAYRPGDRWWLPSF